MSVSDVIGFVFFVIGMTTLLLIAIVLGAIVVEFIESRLAEWSERRQASAREAERIQQEVNESLTHIQAAYWQARQDLRNDSDGR